MSGGDIEEAPNNRLQRTAMCAAAVPSVNATGLRKEKRGRESFLDMEESLPVEGMVCRVVHVLLRVRSPTMC